MITTTTSSPNYTASSEIELGVVGQRSNSNSSTNNIPAAKTAPVTNSGRVGGMAAMARSDRMKLYKRGFCCLGVIFFGLVVILPLSFGRLEYHEMGFLQRKTTGIVFRDETYTAGRYFIGPDMGFVVYPASIVQAFMPPLNAWTRATQTGSASDDAGTEVTLDVSFQYQLIPDELGDLYEKVGTEYKPYISSVVKEIIKTKAVTISADEFIMNRRMVEGAFKAAVAESLREKANAKLINLQLRDVAFTRGAFMARKLAGAVQVLKNDAETFRKNATLTRTETTRQVKLIQNNAYRISEKAKAEAVLITEKAKNEAARLTQDPRHEGLKILADELNITEQKHVMSLDYLFGLLQNNAALYVGFDQVNKNIN